MLAGQQAVMIRGSLKYCEPIQLNKTCHVILCTKIGLCVKQDNLH